MKRLLGIGLFVVLGGVGCASTTPSLQREAARSIGGMAPEACQVSQVQRGLTNVTWQCTTPQGRYQCSADDMLRRTLCVPG